jgi:hypothetical protein
MEDDHLYEELDSHLLYHTIKEKIYLVKTQNGQYKSRMQQIKIPTLYARKVTTEVSFDFTHKNHI